MIKTREMKKSKETNKQMIEKLLSGKTERMTDDVKRVYDLPYQGLPIPSEVGKLLMRMAKRIDYIEDRLAEREK